ncbi:MAG: FGGY-family carbohydrate kinase [Chlorobi bacterium]|nr:FGGY-family carbohydrate kinase [Chlorobiota bacterium]
MNYVIGIDLGTTALKGVLISESGDRTAKAREIMRYEHPGKGIVEFSVEEYYSLFCSLIKNLVSSLPKNGNVAAISISGATGNTVLLNKDNKPVFKAVSWLDNRDDLLPDVFKNIDIYGIHEITGWPYLGIFPLAHLAWFKQKRQKEYYSASHIMLNISYIYFRLTNKFVIDHSTATTFYLANQKQRKWHKQYLDALNIKETILPDLLTSGKTIGNITEKAAIETRLSLNTKVVLGAFDHPTAARGTGVFNTGTMLLSCGTSWVGFYPIKERNEGIKNNMLVDPFLSPKGNWGAMFSLPGVGKTIDNLINYLINTGTMEEKYVEFNTLAGMSHVGANGVMIDLSLPFSQLKSVIHDLEETANLSDIFRAIMEGMAFLIKTKIKFYENRNIPVNEITMVGGASKSRLWVQIIADITEKKIKLLNGQEAGATGSAIIAGIGAGLFADEKDGFMKIGGLPETIEPNGINKKHYQKIYKKHIQEKNSNYGK